MMGISMLGGSIVLPSIFLSLSKQRNINLNIKKMNVITMEMETYEAPKVEVIQVEVENGFAVSIESLGKTYDEIGW